MLKTLMKWLKKYQTRYRNLITAPRSTDIWLAYGTSVCALIMLSTMLIVLSERVNPTIVSGAIVLAIGFILNALKDLFLYWRSIQRCREIMKSIRNAVLYVSLHTNTKAFAIFRLKESTALSAIAMYEKISADLYKYIGGKELADLEEFILPAYHYRDGFIDAEKTNKAEGYEKAEPEFIALEAAVMLRTQHLVYKQNIKDGTASQSLRQLMKVWSSGTLKKDPKPKS